MWVGWREASTQQRGHQIIAHLAVCETTAPNLPKYFCSFCFLLEILILLVKVGLKCCTLGVLSRVREGSEGRGDPREPAVGIPDTSGSQAALSLRPLSPHEPDTSLDLRGFQELAVWGKEEKIRTHTHAQPDQLRGALET